MIGNTVMESFGGNSPPIHSMILKCSGVPHQITANVIGIPLLEYKHNAAFLLRAPWDISTKSLLLVFSAIYTSAISWPFSWVWIIPWATLVQSKPKLLSLTINLTLELFISLICTGILITNNDMYWHWLLIISSRFGQIGNFFAQIFCPNFSPHMSASLKTIVLSKLSAACSKINCFVLMGI